MGLLIKLFFIFFLSFPVFATEEFIVNESVIYQINPSGQSLVEQKVELINRLPEIYPKEYRLALSGNNIHQISANDSGGNILQATDQKQNTTEILLRFNQPGVGKNQSTKFTLTYLINNFATKRGSTWEIILPEYQNLDQSNQFQVTIKIPKEFGKLTYSSLPSNTLNYNEIQNQVLLNRQQLKNKILLSFGNYQIFDFLLTYYLENPSSSIIKTELAIPPNTETQKMTYRQITPPPKTIAVDQDGNWLAQYLLQPQQKITVLVDGQVRIHPLSPSATTDLSDPEALVSEQPYWPVGHPKIQEIAKNLKNPKEIFDFVVSSLSYDYSQINSSRQRQGSLFAINYPQQSLCTEFTDLFITLARAKNIPSREIQGFAYTNNPKIKPLNLQADILHAWPQYYHSAKKTWVSVDPTWTKTTGGINYFNDLDLNHFAFVIHGQNSQYPLPPGAYKSSDSLKTVSVDFAKEEINPSLLPLKISSNKSKILIHNPNGTLYSQLTLNLDGSPWSKNIDLLPPFGSLELDLPRLPFFASLLPKNSHLSFTINSQKHSLTYYPHYFNLSLIIAVSMVILSIGGIILTIHQTHEKNS